MINDYRTTPPLQIERNERQKRPELVQGLMNVSNFPQPLERLFKFRGVSKEYSAPQRSSIIEGSHARYSNSRVTSIEDTASDTSDNDRFIPNIETLTKSRYNSSRNVDNFYSSEEHDSEQNHRDDLSYQYISSIANSDRRFSNNSEVDVKSELNLFNNAMIHNHEAIHVWEQCDEQTKNELRIASGDSPFYEEGSTGNGGVYDPYRPEISTLNTDNMSELLQLSPAAKFRDSIKLAFRTSRTVNGLERSKKYKNNLSVVIKGKSCIDYLLVCCLSEIIVFEFDYIHGGPKSDPCLKFETKPSFTSTSDRIVSTWPYYPHTLNSIRHCKDWMRGPSIGACSDDGSVYIWHVENLVEQIEKYKYKAENRHFSLKIAPDFSLKLNSSAWGIDFCTAIDGKGSKHSILAASSNTESVTFFYFSNKDSFVSKIETHPLLHNIPEVSFLEYTISEETHIALVSCATIFGELLTFKFEFSIELSESDDRFYSASNDGREVNFKTPAVVRRTCLGSDCWTTKPIHSKFFKHVQSIRAMTGDSSIEEEQETTRILTESKILEKCPDYRKSSTLGVATHWQYFESPVVCLASSDTAINDEYDVAKFHTVDEECRRIRLTFENCAEDNVQEGLNDKFLAVSTVNKLGLFRADSLFCTAATKNVFTLDIPSNEDTKWCNRISITEIIPELSCLIAVTQSGIATILRFCEHRGLYGMRQEHLFPNILAIAIGEHSFRTVIGLSVRDTSPSKNCRRFYVYFIYSDGLILTYEIFSCSDRLDFVSM